MAGTTGWTSLRTKTTKAGTSRMSASGRTNRLSTGRQATLSTTALKGRRHAAAFAVARRRRTDRRARTHGCCSGGSCGRCQSCLAATGRSRFTTAQNGRSWSRCRRRWCFGTGLSRRSSTGKGTRSRTPGRRSGWSRRRATRSTFGTRCRRRSYETGRSSRSSRCGRAGSTSRTTTTTTSRRRRRSGPKAFRLTARC